MLANRDENSEFDIGSPGHHIGPRSLQRICDLCVMSETQGNIIGTNTAVAFKVIDKSIHSGNVRGKVTAVELKKAMENWGCSELTEDEVEEMVAQADLQGDGSIDYESFVKCMDQEYDIRQAEDSGNNDVLV